MGQSVWRGRNLDDLRMPYLPPLWREDIIGWDGQYPLIRCPWISGQDPGVDVADDFDRAEANRGSRGRSDA